MAATTIIDLANLDWRMSNRDFDMLIRDLSDVALGDIEHKLKTELAGRQRGGSMGRVFAERLNQVQRARLAARERAASDYRNRVGPVLRSVVLEGREPTPAEHAILQEVTDHLAVTFGIRASEMTTT
ncbi:MAG: hypothetical protein ACRDK3_00475 [Actinomycetota bacterium]